MAQLKELSTLSTRPQLPPPYSHITNNLPSDSRGKSDRKMPVSGISHLHAGRIVAVVTKPQTGLLGKRLQRANGTPGRLHAALSTATGRYCISLYDARPLTNAGNQLLPWR